MTRSNQGHTMRLDTYNPQPMSLQSINFLHLTVSKIQPKQNFIGQGHYGKVKSRSHHDVAHLQPLTNVPTKYQLPTPYGFCDTARGKLFPTSLPKLPPIQTPWMKTIPRQPLKAVGKNIWYILIFCKIHKSKVHKNTMKQKLI